MTCLVCVLQIYAGFIEDPRNTDNAWIETVVVSFHDNAGRVLHNFKLHAGDDARAVKWVELRRDMDIYPSFLYLLEQVAILRGAAW